MEELAHELQQQLITHDCTENWWSVSMVNYSLVSDKLSALPAL